jgi:rRNA maturation endonuclease Nob1
MGFFKRIGREVEQFKQTATETATQKANYQCEACEAHFYSRPEQCSKCGAESIVSVRPDE